MGWLANKTGSPVHHAVCTRDAQCSTAGAQWTKEAMSASLDSSHARGRELNLLTCFKHMRRRTGLFILTSN